MSAIASHDTELQRLAARAQLSANGQGHATAVYNLNPAGKRLLVIRAYADCGDRDLKAGPFQPEQESAA